jgi:hypothetical protein
MLTAVSVRLAYVLYYILYYILYYALAYANGSERTLSVRKVKKYLPTFQNVCLLCRPKCLCCVAEQSNCAEDVVLCTIIIMRKQIKKMYG